jgi:hypothetical protein
MTTATSTDASDAAASSSSKMIKTDDKKQHFDDIYVAPTPVPYKTRILDELSYISDDFNRAMFDVHILPHVMKTDNSAQKPLHYVDLCACFGNTTMACVNGMTYDEICSNWKDEEHCQKIDKPKRIPNCHVTAVDISSPAMSYGRRVGLYDTAIVCNLNDRSSAEFNETIACMKRADVMISTAALVYLDLETIEQLIEAFANGESNHGNKYVLVNFLNPFALEKADQTKRILLKHLDFVGSRATRHRKLSQLEQDNYPGEEWSLLELWVLTKKQK